MYGVNEGKGNDIARCDQRLGNAFVRSASAAIAGNLRNLQHCQLCLRVLACVAHQFVRNLHGGGHPRIGKDAAPERARKIEVQNAARKIGAITVMEVKAGAVNPRVHLGDECVVLPRIFCQ